MRLFLFLSLLPAFFLHFPLPAAAALNSREKALVPLFEEPCRRFGIPRVLALAIARQESDSRPLLINIQGKDVLPRTPAEALRMGSPVLRGGCPSMSDSCRSIPTGYAVTASPCAGFSIPVTTFTWPALFWRRARGATARPEKLSGITTRVRHGAVTAISPAYGTISGISSKGRDSVRGRIYSEKNSSFPAGPFSPESLSCTRIRAAPGEKNADRARGT